MAASRDSTILRVLILAATLTFAPQPVASLSWVADLQFTSDTDEATELPESFHVGLSASGSLSPTVLYPVPSGVTFGSGSAGTIFKTAVGEGGNIGGGGSDSGETTSFITITDTATTIEASAVVSLSTELILTGTQVFSAGSVIGSGIRDVISGDASTSAASSLFLGQVESATSVPFDDSQSPSRIESDAGFPTTTFPNAMQITPTLSPSTTIFTIATSYSLFTTAGHVTSTPVPVLSTSVMMVPITPTQTSKASKHSLSTSMSVGIAIAGVAVFLVGVLIYIVRWRRKLRRRAFLRLGEEF